MDQQAILFWIIAAFTGLSGIAVLVSQNIVRSAIWLLFTLGGVSAVFFLLGADFVAATQLIIYVGGILVLVVFGVMLTAQGPFITMKVGAAEWIIATFVGLSLLAVLFMSRPDEFAFRQPSRDMNNARTSMSSTELGLVLQGLEGATPEGNLTGLPVGAVPVARKRMSYLLPFEIVSVHLLVVLIGAAYLARAKRRRGAVP